MSRHVSYPLLPAFFGVALLLGGVSVGLAQERVGVSSAVNQQAVATPPGQTARPLIIGQDVVYNERITTTDAGQTQLLFVDESSMTIGPNSDLTIDQFVYDPKSGTGKLAMTTTRGLLRYVGGKLSKQDQAVTMRTNSATLAVRGGAFLLTQAPGGSLEAVFIYGRGLTITGTTGASQLLQRPGFAVSIAGPGAAPTAPFPVPPGQLAQLLAQLDGRRGASGGARIVPTEQAVAASGVEQTISGNIPASVQQAAAQTQTANQPAIVNPATVQTNANVQTAVNTAVDCVAQGTCPPQTVTTSPTQTTTTTTTTTTTGAYGGFYKTTPGTGSSVGFVSFSPSFNIPYTGGQIGSDGFYTANLNGATIRFPVNTNGGFRTFTAADGTTSPFGPISGTSFLSNDKTYLFSNNTEVDFTNEHSFVYGGIPVNPTFYQPRPALQVNAYALQPDAALNSPVPYTTNNFGGAIANPFVSPLVVVAAPNQQFGAGNAITDPSGTTIRPKYAQVSFAVNGSGPSQSSLLVVNTGAFFTTGDTGKVAAAGAVRGSFQPNGTLANQVRIASGSATVPDGAGNNLFGANNLTGFVLDQNGVNGTTESVQQQLATAAQFNGTTTNYAFNQPAVTIPLPFTPGTRTTQTQTGWFGGTMYPRQAGGGLPTGYVLQGATVVSTDATTNRVGATFGGGDPFTGAQSGITGMTINFGGTTGPNRGRDTFIDDNTFVATESASNPSQINGNSLPLPGTQNQNNAPTLGLVTSISNFNNIQGVTPCDCQYLKWGFWTGQLNQVDSSGNVTRSDRAFINTWLAGVPTSAADLNTLQASAITGTYAGAAYGSVLNNGASYLAAGNFNATYNFASQTGSFGISNFDGRNFSSTGTVPLASSGNINVYAGALTGTNLTGQFAGSFYGPMAANTGGTFSVRSANTGSPFNYLASGIFAGKR